MKKIYETPCMEEIKIKIQDVMAESVDGEGSITDDELFGPQN
jgi:hypothetical protein